MTVPPRLADHPPMPTKDSLDVFLRSLETKSYYDVLRIPRDVHPSAIKLAFHEFSLLYHPDRCVDSSLEAALVASEIYKRGVEAYRCLSRQATRARYDRGLVRGALRLNASRLSTVPPPPGQTPRTLEAVALTPQGKRFASKGDRLIAIGKLQDARVALVSACQCEPNNEELAERLQILYEALALEPP
jgi:curved DNA-binding protein CbpA